MAKKLRLLKVLVQPIFVVDDGHNITEECAQVVSVPACEWADFATRIFQEQTDALRNKFENNQDS